MIILFIPQVPIVWARKFKIIYGEILPGCKKPNNNLEVHWNDQLIENKRIWESEPLNPAQPRPIHLTTKE